MAIKPMLVRFVGLLLTFAVVACASQAAWAQTSLLANRAVGGVLIDPAGNIQTAPADLRGEIQRIWREQRAELPEGLAQATQTRRISLRKLEATLSECVDAGQPIPEAAVCLGGMLEIDYVLVYPEQQDIVLVGPAEPWEVNAQGAFVGRSSGRPTLLLEDLMVALRSAFAPQRRVISCSIDPTPEGIQRFNAYFRANRRIGVPQQTARNAEEALGPQLVSIEGVPADSHFARVLAAADYRMKRISMGAEPAPVPGLPSFMQLLVQNRRLPGNALPRWWLAPENEPVLRDGEGLAWHLQKIGVKTMAESDLFDATGRREKTQKADPIFQAWAERMTERYDELALAEPIFGELRNCMEVSVAAACIAQENLLQKANLQMPTLLGGVHHVSLEPPKQVEPKTVIAKVRNNWVITSGGVQINPWQIVANAEVDPQLAEATARIEYPAGETWWAN